MRDVRGCFVRINIDRTMQPYNAIRPVQSTLGPMNARVHPTAFRGCRLSDSSALCFVRRAKERANCEAFVMLRGSACVAPACRARESCVRIARASRYVSRYVMRLRVEYARRSSRDASRVHGRGARPRASLPCELDLGRRRRCRSARDVAAIRLRESRFWNAHRQHAAIESCVNPAVAHAARQLE